MSDYPDAILAEVSAAVASILGRDVDAAADLFDLGLTSLSFVLLLAKLNDRHGTSLNGSELGDVASVRSVAATLARSATVV